MNTATTTQKPADSPALPGTFDLSQATPKPIGSLSRADVLNHLHLLEPRDVLALLRPMFVLRGKMAGRVSLTLGRDLTFLADHGVGAHVLRFADYGDLVKREAELRKVMTRSEVVTTEFEVRLPDGPGTKVEKPSAPVTAPAKPTPVDTAADALAAATTKWEARWSSREGVLVRTIESDLRHEVQQRGIECDLHCGKAPMVKALMEFEKREALFALEASGQVLPDTAEVRAMRGLGTAEAQRTKQPETKENAHPEAPTENTIPPAPSTSSAPSGSGPAGPAKPLPPVATMQTMPLDELRAMTGLTGDRRDILRKVKAGDLQPVGA